MSRRFLSGLLQQIQTVCSSANGRRNARRRKSLRDSAVSEMLETRRLPATLIGATQVKYQDLDGDDVTVTFSKPILTSGNVNTIFTFHTGNVDGSNATRQQLQSINLTGITAAAGTNITTVATRNSVTKGDGLAAIGQINATGLDVGTITVDGDLGRIRAGDATLTTQAVAALNAHSMGRFRLATGSGSFTSQINGRLGALTLKTDFHEIRLLVNGGANGQIGPVTINGSIHWRIRQ